MTAHHADETRRPHVVLIHRYFWPDTPPYANILMEIALGLADDGMDVTVLTCQPSYRPESVEPAQSCESFGDHVMVRRWPVLADRSSTIAKVVNMVVFAARVFFRLAASRRPAAVMAASTPPVFVALVASIVCKARRVPFVYHKQDIYPEVTDAGAALPALLRRLLRRLDTGTDRRSARVVVLSRDMASTTTARGVDADRIEIINNFDPWRVDEQRTPRAESAMVRFVYAGNLGRFQNLEGLAEAIAPIGSDRRFIFDFIGDGPMRGWLERFIAARGLTQVQVLGYLPPDQLAERLRVQYDVGLLSLEPGVIRGAYPSKTMSYLRHGLPVLAYLEPDCELADALDSNDAGWVSDPGRRGSLQESAEHIFDARATLQIKQENARRMYKREFDGSRQLRRWAVLYRSLARNQS